MVGESGAGKSTVGRSILNLIKTTSGDIHFQDVDFNKMSSKALHTLRHNCQIIFQDPYSSMNPRMLVADIIAEGLLAQRIEKNVKACYPQIDRLLKQVGLPANSKFRYPHEFSGGQSQRICIARALAVEPKLLVCDEPTSALDATIQVQILDLLRDLQKRLNLSYLLITHNIGVVKYLAHEVAVMKSGKIVEHGTAAQVLRSPQHHYTRKLLAAMPSHSSRSKGRHRSR